MIEKYKTGRRQVIGGLGACLASWIVTSGFASPSLNMESSSSIQSSNLEDPTKKYPKPPFKSQSQPWPGLAGKMDPRPDHGEKSYKGSGRLTGRKALITGGDSGMGEQPRSRTHVKAPTWRSTIFLQKNPMQKKLLNSLKMQAEKLLLCLAIYVMKHSAKG